jgi:hypothetical protein
MSDTTHGCATRTFTRGFRMESMHHTSTDDKQKTDFAPLSCEELATVHGGVMRVMVDGRTPATMDELALNMEIFKGNIGGPMVL